MFVVVCTMYVCIYVYIVVCTMYVCMYVYTMNVCNPNPYPNPKRLIGLTRVIRLGNGSVGRQ